jgi:acyl transferase domain-containing protein
MPSSTSQEVLIRETYEKAGLSMEPTRYFEAHGTGTPVGDPLEATALGAAFRKTRTSDDSLIVGAVKSNIGQYVFTKEGELFKFIYLLLNY